MRRAFTLIELLVVLAIISLLVALTTAGIMKFMDTGPQSATRVQLRSLISKLDAQWKAVRDEAQREPIPDLTFNTIKASLTAPNNTGADVRKAYVNAKLVQAFPQSMAEALKPDGTRNAILAYSPYVNYLKELGIDPVGPPPVPPVTRANATAEERAICLLMILERGPHNTGVTADSFGAGGTTTLTFNDAQSPARPHSGRGLVDGWVRPLIFSRSSVPATAGNATQGLTIVSAGRDGKWGINLDTLAVITAQAQYAKDNLDTTNVP
jgi:prepilin-type N-terminal cleavage/methylation domain-containing protein